MADWRASDVHRHEHSGLALSGRAAAGVLGPDALAIARTVIYASLFDYPLTLAQLRESLIESRQSEAEILATYAASGALQAIVEHQKGFFFPRGRSALAAERLRREARSRGFLLRHRRLLGMVCALPYVRMVALSGSVAHLNLDSEGDLDLFIVTRGHRVWSVTVAVVVLAKLLRRRRLVCANFVVADSQLTFEHQDLFTANQVIHLKPIVGGDVIDEMLSANPFVARFYPNFEPHGPAASPISIHRRFGRVRRALEGVLAAPSFVMEQASRWAYRRYLRGRLRSWRSPDQVRLDADCLKLHTQSHRHSTLERFDRAVWDAGVQAVRELPLHGTVLMTACSSENAGRLDQSGLTMALPQSSVEGSSYKS